MMSPDNVSKNKSGRSGCNENIYAIVPTIIEDDKNPSPAVGVSQESDGSSATGSSTSESSYSDSDGESDTSIKFYDHASDLIGSDSSITTTKMSSTIKSLICDGNRCGF